MASKFLIQVLHKSSGEAVQCEPGRDVELDLIQSIANKIVNARLKFPKGTYEGFIQMSADAIAKRGVGMWTTEAHVVQDIKDGLREVLATGVLNEDPNISWMNEVEKAVSDTFKELKQKVKPE